MFFYGVITLIRTAAADDYESLQILYRELIPDDPRIEESSGRDILRSIVESPLTDIFVLVADAAIVSTCTLVIVPNLTRGGRPYAVIENVITSREYRRRGYGDAVMGHAIRAAKEAGCYKIMLLTGSANPGTHKFYKQLGFRDDLKTGYVIKEDVPGAAQF